MKSQTDLQKLLPRPTPNAGQLLSPSAICDLMNQAGHEYTPSKVEQYLQSNHFEPKRVIEGNDLSSKYYVDVTPIQPSQSQHNQNVTHVHVPKQEDKVCSWVAKTLAVLLSVSMLANLILIIFK